MKYFAYGSNLLVAKLRSPERCPTAEIIPPSEGSQYFIRKHKFKFHKRSIDGSAKGDAEATNDDNDIVYGVLFKIDDVDEIKKLRDQEGSTGLNPGYEEKDVNVIDEKTSEIIPATTFCAKTDFIESDDKPYDWYKRQTVQGAIDNGLPDDYIKKLEDLESKYDKKESRRKDEEVYFKYCGKCEQRQYFESHTPGDCTTTSTPRN